MLCFAVDLSTDHDCEEVNSIRLNSSINNCGPSCFPTEEIGMNCLENQADSYIPENSGE